MSTPVNTPADPSVASANALSEMQRLTYIFYRPSDTFRDLKRSAMWIAPFVLLAVFSLAFIATIDKKIGFDQVVTNMQNNMPPADKDRFDSLPPEQRAAQDRGMRLGVKYTSYGFPILMLLIALLFAAVFMATMNFGMGAEIRFKQALAVVMYAWLPGILRSLFGVLGILAGSDPEAFNLENPVATNPGFFINPVEHPALFRLLSGLDVIQIWTLFLMGIGLAIVGNKKRGSGLACVFGWYFLILLVRTAWAAR